MASPESTTRDRKQLLQRALLQIESLESRLEASERAMREPIAIVGMGCRFPAGANDPEAFWRLLRDGRDAITEVPPERWRAEDYYDSDPDAIGKAYVMRGGFLDEVDCFDAAFFGISPREAEQMDPQQRLLLEVAWESLEDAGIAPASLVGTPTGAFVGMTASDFLYVNSGRDVANIDTYFASGNSHSIAAGRLAYVLGLKGPAMTIDTACSAALVAVHQACHSLRVGECRTALAGGVLLIFSPEGFVTCCKSRLLSPDGYCKTFDASADGYVRAEGCAMVALKKLSDAEADGDNVLAVIRGSAINQDGRSSGLTAPSGNAQEEVIRQALANAGVSPTEVSYVEAHGTGTSLGDPIEVQALGAVHTEGRDPARPLLIGSVKTNIGHTEGVAGLAGLVKVVLSLRHGQIPPHLHVREPNPHIPWSDYPIAVPDELVDWPSWAERRIAGLSSFGFSGTNVHMIVEEAPGRVASESELRRPLHVLTLSGRREAAVTELAGAHRERLLAESAGSAEDHCFTANAGRSHFEHRAAVIGSSREELADALEACRTGRDVPGVYRGRIQPNREPTVGFLFTGQGAQYVGMGRELFETQPTFREALERCDALLRDRLEHPLLSLLYPSEDFEQEARALLNQTAYTQPALFALEWALAELWRSWGVTPSVVMGHSVGEFAAACVAGIMSVEDGAALIAERGRMMQALPEGGAMSAIFAGEPLVREAIAEYPDTVSVAGLNGPENVVISGVARDVEAVTSRLAAEGIEWRGLEVSHAFHSPLMESVTEPFAGVAGTIEFAPPGIDFVSTVTGRVASPHDVTSAAYWSGQIRSEVRFVDAMETLRDHGCQAFVEIGPSPTLLGMGRRCLPQSTAEWLPSLRPDRGGWEQILASLATLYVRGADIDWAGFDRDYPRRMVSVPTYPFERTRYSVAPAEPAAVPADPSLHPLLGRRVRSPVIEDWVWEAQLDGAQAGRLGEYLLYETPVVPAASVLEAALAASREIAPGDSASLEDVVFERVPTLEAGRPTTAQTVVSRPDGGSATLRFFSRSGGPGADEREWTLHARCSLGWSAGETEEVQIEPADRAAWEARCSEEISGGELHELLTDAGVTAGPAFRQVESLRRRDGEVLGRLQLGGEEGDSADRPELSPGVIDACMQMLLAAMPGMPAFKPGAMIHAPRSVRRLRVLGELPETLHVHGEVRAGGGDPSAVEADLQLFDDDGRVLVEATGVTIGPLDRESFPAGVHGRFERWLYDVSWVPEARPGVEAGSSPASGSWVVLADAGGLGSALAELLRERGHHATLVFAGEEFSVGDGGDVTIDPTRREDFQKLVAGLAGSDGTASPRSLVSLWPLDLEPPGGDVARTSDGVAQACDRFLGLVHAIAHADAAAKPSLALVTRGAQPVEEGEGSLALRQTSLWGIARVLKNEHPEIPYRVIDVDPAADVAEAALDLLGELMSDDFSETQVGFRGGQRFVARLARRGVETVGRLDLSEGSYLVTGGLGGLGLAVARLFVERGAKHVFLTGRSAPSEPALQTISELTAAGAEVTTLRADVSDAKAMREALAKIDEAGAPLRGVVHSAGLIDDALLLHQDLSRLEPVLAPKVDGSWILHSLTHDRELDFFVLFSSASTLFGAAGQGNYAAANAFLDGLAHERRAMGRPALSVNWGAWSDVGMAAAMGSDTHDRWAASGFGEIEPHDGVEALELAMLQDMPEVAILPVNWRQWRKTYRGSTLPPFVADLVLARTGDADGPSASVTELRALLAAGNGAREAPLTEFVTEQIAGLLGLSAATVDVEQSVADLGFDSLMAMELKNRIERDLDMVVPVAHLLDGPSVTELATRLIHELDAAGGGGGTPSPELALEPAGADWEEGEL